MKRKLSELPQSQQRTINAMLAARRTHRMTRSKVYRVWAAMKDRCLNEKCKDYPNYGGRGITLDPKWLQFENFFSDRGEPNGLTLERRDNSSGYSEDNCRWASRLEQNNNRRDTTFVLVNGFKRSMAQASRELNVFVETLRYRVKHNTYRQHHPEITLIKLGETK